MPKKSSKRTTKPVNRKYAKGGLVTVGLRRELMRALTRFWKVTHCSSDHNTASNRAMSFLDHFGYNVGQRLPPHDQLWD